MRRTSIVNYMIRKMRAAVAHSYRSLLFPPIVIACAILVATGFTYHTSRQSLTHDVMSAVNTRTRETEQSIHSTMQSYEEILQGGIGLFRGSSTVTAADWSHFITTFDISGSYTAVQGFGFAKVVNVADVDAYSSYIQDQGGVPGFHIYPLSSRGQYAPLVYFQAVAQQQSPKIGYDQWVQPTREIAMNQARDTGKATITSRVTLAPGDGSVTYPGFVMYAPYFTPGMPSSTPAERTTAIYGYAYTAFRADLFFKSVSTTTDNDSSGYQVTVGNDTAPLYQSAHYADINKIGHITTSTKSFSLYGQTWQVRFVFKRNAVVSNVQLRRPNSVLVAGAFASLLIATVVYLLLSFRAQELTAQKEQAVELAKDELLSLASHQLRTPATGVKQYLGMVLQGFAGDVPAEQMRLLEKAYASNDRQLSIINEILHLAKIESGRIVLSRQDVDLSAMLEDIVTEQQPDIKAAKHQLSLQLPNRALHLYLDAHTIRMAIENILSNAIKYTPQGGEITVKLYKNKENAYVRVKDTGVGVSQGDIEKLFKQFSRLPNEMSLKVGGTGIGLYLAKHLVELHDGNILVRSTPGQGSTFTIVLPLHSEEQL